MFLSSCEFGGNSRRGAENSASVHIISLSFAYPPTRIQFSTLLSNTLPSPSRPAQQNSKYHAMFVTTSYRCCGGNYPKLLTQALSTFVNILSLVVPTRPQVAADRQGARKQASQCTTEEAHCLVRIILINLI